MTRSRKIILGGLILVIIGSLAGLGYMLRPQSDNVPKQMLTETGIGDTGGITLAEVEKHTGRDGNSCWVVVDDTVYEISGFMQWADGVHSPSGGKARCGKDLSEVINESPHGKSKLKYLKEIGTFKR